MRKLRVLLLLLFTLLLSSNVESFASSTYTVDSEVVHDNGYITHTRLVATVSDEWNSFPQVINVLEENAGGSSDLFVVVGDVYPAYEFSRGNILNIAYDVEARYDYLVIGGVNGDFYNIYTGQPVELYVRDGRVVFQGSGEDRDGVCVKDTGSITMGNPEFGDYKLVLLDEDENILNEYTVDNFNTYPVNDELSIYFTEGTYSNDNGFATHKIIADEYLNFSGSLYLSGEVNFNNYLQFNVFEHETMIMTNNSEINSVLAEAYSAYVHRELIGSFENCEHSIGGWGAIVKYGQIVNDIVSVAPTARHPRTAVGIKSDGTIVMVTVDGRQELDGMYGVTLYQLAEIMQSLGCINAYNLDGGGSTTMISRPSIDEDLSILNSPSDGQLRRISNAIFFAIRRPVDEVPPVILGAPESFVLRVDSTEPDWLEGISATDDETLVQTVEVDASDVDLSTIGTYEVIYTAIDEALNETVIRVPVNVITNEIIGIDQQFPGPTEDNSLTAFQIYFSIGAVTLILAVFIVLRKK